MTLNLRTSCFSRLLHHPSSSFLKLPKTCVNHAANTNSSFPYLFFTTPSLSNLSRFLYSKASVNESHNETSYDTANILDQLLLLQVTANAKTSMRPCRLSPTVPPRTTVSFPPLTTPMSYSLCLTTTISNLLSPSYTPCTPIFIQVISLFSSRKFFFPCSCLVKCVATIEVSLLSF